MEVVSKQKKSLKSDSQNFQEYLDSLTRKEFPNVKQRIKLMLDWNEVQFSQRKNGNVSIKAAEKIALEVVTGTKIF